MIDVNAVLIKNTSRYRSLKGMETRDAPWVGFDFDGTLVNYNHWVSPSHVGAPIVSTILKLESLLASGRRVKIFTARVFPLCGVALDGSVEHILSNVTVSVDQGVEAAQAIFNWCSMQFGHPLEITCCKDYACTEIYDDIAIQIIRNTGKRADGHPL